jgi:shikimate kinase
MFQENEAVLFKLEKNIFLTGIMGAGKTSTGITLARLLGVAFFDCDMLISKIEGMEISEIFKCHGEAYFRQREAEMLEMLSEKKAGSCVVSTGGGAVLRPGNIEAMRKNGIIIFLDIPAAEACDRIKDSPDRPLLQVEHPLQKLEQLLQERQPYYRQADFCINTFGKDVQQVTAEIMQMLIDDRQGDGCGD